MPTCELLLTTENGQIIAGTIVLEAGQIVTHANAGYEVVMRNVLDESHIVGDQQVSIKHDAEKWFYSLPEHFSGSYLRARIISKE